MSVDGNILTVKVDLSKEFGPSASGKTIIIASTEGNVPIEGTRRSQDRFEYLSQENAIIGAPRPDAPPAFLPGRERLLFPASTPL